MTQNIRERRFEVDQNFDGWRLDRFLANRIGRLSRSRAGDIARYGDVQVVPARRIKAGTRLRLGDVVIVREHLPPEVVQDDEVGVLHSDDDLLILDKPPGMLVHEVASTRLNTVVGFLERGGFEGAEPVHRIDRETSGVVVCAARPELVPTLREMFATDHPRKLYRAIVVDSAASWRPGHRETITEPLRLQTETALGLRMVVSKEGGLSATTHVEALAHRDGLSDLLIQIETGRQHQIRAHLAHRGTPVAGDKLYTYDDQFFMDITDRPDDAELLAQLPFARHMLHAWMVEFEWPRSTGQIVSFLAPIPPQWVACFDM